MASSTAVLAKEDRVSQLINANTRLNKALDLHPQVLDYIVSLNPHDFQRLHNPLMRRLMAPRITLGRIAKMTQVPLAELLAHIATLSGATVEEDVVEHDLPQSPTEPPSWVVNAPPETVTEVNLLPLDATLEADPLLPVMQAVKALTPGAVLCIRHQWEPQPFYDVWAKMGDVEWYATEVTGTEWHIWVRRRPR
jgi:Domain of unknown function (DUF1858)/Uncharacterized conserved protein (DUF2249)